MICPGIIRGILEKIQKHVSLHTSWGYDIPSYFASYFIAIAKHVTKNNLLAKYSLKNEIIGE